MEKSVQQIRKQEDENADKKRREEGLPMESSPYTQYKDLEDYKRQGYGAEGHLEPKTGRGAAASTDAPTSKLETSPTEITSKHETSPTEITSKLETSTTEITSKGPSFP